MSEQRKIEAALMKTSELAAHVGITAKQLRAWQQKSAHNIPRPALRDTSIVYYNRADAMRWVAALKRGELA